MPEQDYAVPVYPHNIVMTYGAEASSERIIGWRCDTVVQAAWLSLVKAGETDTIRTAAEGYIVHSQAGKAAYYRAQLNGLEQGEYLYQCLTGEQTSDWHTFTVTERTTDSIGFLLFGDVQDKTTEISRRLFAQAFGNYPEAHFAAFAGDIWERPADCYQQSWFRAMEGRTSLYPIEAAAGNHEYLKGIIKQPDARWTAIFPNPQNGPYRLLGRSYHIDFPLMRFIVLDTDALHRLSDYTLTQVWLTRALREAEGRWKVVMMHHPVYSAGKGRINPFIWLAFRGTLQDADVIFSGHDHNYLRRGDGTDALGRPAPVFVVTNSSNKHYAPKKHPNADVYLHGKTLYEWVTLTADSLRVESRVAETDSIADTFVLYR